VEVLEGKVAVVTGAASGMGRAFAQRFAEAGMKVALADIEVEALDQAVAELAADGHTAIGVRTDVSKRDEVELLAERATSELGNVNVVCNNAGIEGYIGRKLWAATEKDWAWTLGVNLWGVIHGVQAFVPRMLDHGEESHVVNTASMTAVTRPGSMYGVSKHAVLSLTEVLDTHLREQGANIGVSALCPGTIATRLFQGRRNRPSELRDAEEGPEPEADRQRREMMDARLAAGMSPDEVARQLLDAIRANRFYVLSDHDWDDQIQARTAAILGETGVAGS
jgi:NAD(P)-dependent dehydrogenase (short-subunit alcohol dehydrogenase family)